MNALPIFQAALRAVGGDPDATTISSETIEAAQLALRAVDRKLGQALGHVTLTEVTLGGAPLSASAPAPVKGPSALDLRALEIADRIVPEYRASQNTYSCGGQMAKRWQAAYDAACAAIGGDA